MYQPGTSTGSIAVTAGTQSVTGPGVLLLSQLTAAAATATVTVYDGTSTAGLQLSNLSAVANTSVNAAVEGGVVFNTGLYVVVTGVGGTAILSYRKN